MKVTEAPDYVGHRVFYRSKKKKSGVQVELVKIVDESYAIVRHLGQGNDFQVHVRELCPTHLDPHGEIVGAFKKSDIVPLGLSFAVGDKIYHAFWDEEYGDPDGPGTWVLSREGRVVTTSSEHIDELIGKIEEIFAEAEEGRD